MGEYTITCARAIDFFKATVDEINDANFADTVSDVLLWLWFAMVKCGT